jgi:hypothetical protein
MRCPQASTLIDTVPRSPNSGKLTRPLHPKSPSLSLVSGKRLLNDQSEKKIYGEKEDHFMF